MQQTTGNSFSNLCLAHISIVIFFERTHFKCNFLFSFFLAKLLATVQIGVHLCADATRIHFRWGKKWKIRPLNLSPERSSEWFVLLAVCSVHPLNSHQIGKKIFFMPICVHKHTNTASYICEICSKQKTQLYDSVRKANSLLAKF